MGGRRAAARLAASDAPQGRHGAPRLRARREALLLCEGGSADDDNGHLRVRGHVLGEGALQAWKEEVSARLAQQARQEKALPRSPFDCSTHHDCGLQAPEAAGAHDEHVGLQLGQVDEVDKLRLFADEEAAPGGSTIHRVGSIVAREKAQGESRKMILVARATAQIGIERAHTA